MNQRQTLAIDAEMQEQMGDEMGARGRHGHVGENYHFFPVLTTKSIERNEKKQKLERRML